MTPRILHQDDERTIAAVDSLIVLVARQPATADDVRRIGRELRTLALEYPKGVGYVHVIDSRPGEKRRVPDETRAAFVELAKNAPPEARCVAVVLLAEGFIAAAMRGVIAAVLAAFRAPMPLRVFSSVGDACGWIEACYEDAGSALAPAREVARAIEGMRRAP